MAVGYPLSRKYVLTHQAPLRFNENGEFRILHLSDIHKIHPEMQNELKYSDHAAEKSEKTLECIRKCVEEAKPDLVVFGGDYIQGYVHGWTYEYLTWCLDRITAPIREKNIPLAIVFGNHDAEQEPECPVLSKEIQLTLFMNYNEFRGCYNEEEMYGAGNCHLPVYAKDSNDVLWNIWCVDSNDVRRNEDYSRTKGDAAVDKSQIDWYERTVAMEKEKFGRTIPAILFQHIPVNQVWDHIEQCGAVEADFKWNDKYFHTKEGFLKEGLLRERPCTSPSRDQFEAWKRCGDIRAAFFGHDHTNTFRYDVDGISLYQTVTCGYENYGIEHGGRLIVLHDDGKTIETKMIIA